MTLLGILLALFALSRPAIGAEWTCSAKNMITGTYDGGRTAYIHLAPYNRGHDYPVTKMGKKVTGHTTNGTPFVCQAR